MRKAPGHVTVTTEVGYCNFCGRPRNLRREERRLGELVRANVTCESCHRTLFSTVGVAPTAQGEPSAPATPAEAAPAPVTPAFAPAAEPATRTARPAAVKTRAAQAKPKPAAKRAAKGR